jgi:hypothetical protein
MADSVDKINALLSKYNTMDWTKAAEAPNDVRQLMGQAPIDGGTNGLSGGTDGLSLSKEMQKAQQAQQAPKQDNGTGAMLGAMGIGMGMNLLGKIIDGIFGKKGGGGGGGDDGGGGDCGGGGGG